MARSAVGVRSSRWTVVVRRLRPYNHWGKLQFVFTASILVFTASLRSECSCCALEYPITFPSSLLRSHRRRCLTAMGKPKKSSSAAGTSTAGGNKGATATRVTDGGWRRSETRESDLRKLRERGLIPQDREAVRLPGFLRGLLFLYGIQLHHLSPNSLLHIACF